MKDKEAAINQLREEMDAFNVRMRQTKEELAEREGQLRVAKMSLETVQKQNQHHMQEVGNFKFQC